MNSIVFSVLIASCNWPPVGWTWARTRSGPCESELARAIRQIACEPLNAGGKLQFLRAVSFGMNSGPSLRSRFSIRDGDSISDHVGWSRSAAPKCRPADGTYRRSRSPSGTLGDSRAAIDDVELPSRRRRGFGNVIEVGDSCFDHSLPICVDGRWSMNVARILSLAWAPNADGRCRCATRHIPRAH